MARFALIVANHGREREIGLLQGRRGNLGAQVMAESSAASLAEWMRDVVERGTARGVFDSLPVEVAGKTGTAENEERDRRPHSWFIGFAPASRSKVAFACIVENGGYGRNAAAPVMREVLKVLFP
jgi:cell division protein FtsI/penicillin-binding protein 2